MSEPIQKSYVDVGVAPDLEIMQGPEGCLGTWRLQLGSERWALNPEILRWHLGPEGRRGTRRFSFRSWDQIWDPEVIWELRDHGIMFGPGGRREEPEDSPLDPEIMGGTLRS
ncbi:hypothetical protein F2Q68_00004454 [Brassica cretica]|uniref:Uncharacterized protein n=1 Tax=Brassica cretica TaxID=69181 RepID=A0A3N6QPB6_BRACR|nr:hypothetical protein F2Q68_00004454 [Brassica cretica]